MAEALRPGGVYKVGNRWVDANGAEAEAPSRTERSEARAEQREAEAARAAVDAQRQPVEAPRVPRRQG
jgi:hypothetical protein